MELPNKNHNLAPKWSRRRMALLGTGILLSAGIAALSGYLRLGPTTPTQERPVLEREYALHENITATVFWVGEDANASNDFIHNRASAWTLDWVGAYGGIDSPENRCGYWPCQFVPKENPFYFALPYSDRTRQGLKSSDELKIVPWYDETAAAQGLLLKNRWIEIEYNDKKAYAQWEDVGPFNNDDASYVFGSDPPQAKRAGLDVSPAVADYLQTGGRAIVSWRFIDKADVPDGEWNKIITHSIPKYNE